MSNLRRVIQQRSNLTDEDSDRVERVLRDYSRGRVSEREAARQLRSLVPEEEGMGVNDLLPLLLLLVGGRQSGTDIGDILNNLLRGQNSRTDLRDIVGNLLGGGDSQPQRNEGLLGMINGLIGRQEPKKTKRSRKKD